VFTQGGAVSGFECISSNDGCVISTLDSTWQEEAVF